MSVCTTSASDGWVSTCEELSCSSVKTNTFLLGSGPSIDAVFPTENNAYQYKLMEIFTQFKKICIFYLLRSTLVSCFFTELRIRIFQRFRLVKFIKKFKTRVKNLKIEKIVAFDKYLHELFFAFYFHLSKNLLLTLKNNEVADLTHFSTKCSWF